VENRVEIVLAAQSCRRIFEPMPDSGKIIRYSLEILAIAVPLAGMTYFLFYPDAFNAFLNWLLKTL
jgi:hypothetical protein